MIEANPSVSPPTIDVERNAAAKNDCSTVTVAAGIDGDAATATQPDLAPLPSTEKVDWLLLFYLAGDLDNPRGNAIRDDLCEILSAPLNPNVRVVVQFDCHDNCYRYIPSVHPKNSKSVDWIIGRSGLGRDGKERFEWEEKEGHYYFEGLPEETREPYEILGRINSGSEEELENFLVWGMSMVPSERVALVLSGKNKLERDRLTAGNARHPIVFTICRDDSTRKHLGFVDFSRSIKAALEKSGRERLDILALDSSQSQFLELAHELDKAVGVLVGPQTAIPMCGWNYTKVIEAWQEAAMAMPPGSKKAEEKQKKADDPNGVSKLVSQSPDDVRNVGEALVKVISESYFSAIQETAKEKGRPGYKKRKPMAPRFIDAEGEPDVCSVSALDLSNLEGVSINFDTVCLSFMQAMGEGQIWDTRVILHEFLWKMGTNDAATERKFEDSYDCTTFFGLLELSMRMKSATSTADWLAWTLANHGSGDWNQLFWNKLRNSLKSVLERPSLTFKGRDRTGQFVECEADVEWLRKIREVLGDHEKHKSNPADREQENQAHLRKGRKLQEMLRKETWDLMAKWYKQGDRDALATELMNRDAADNWLFDVTKKLVIHLSEERQQSFIHSDRASRISARLADQARTLLGNLEVGRGLVIAKASTEFRNDRRWSGISLYRPARLDELMNAEYQKFSFHRKIHWAALLGAIHLIENRGEAIKPEAVSDAHGAAGHDVDWSMDLPVRDENMQRPPLAMWRLISSLLTTGSASTRRDLLERLSGENSVIFGMRNQFRVLAPAPMLTLSIEKSEGKSDHYQFTARLESTRQNAVLTECKGSVRKEILEGLVTGVNRLLQGGPKEPEFRLKRLKSFGSILGDEVLQHLGRILGVEARSISDEARSQGVEKPVVHLQLHLTQELMRYPWELMSFDNKMLGEELAIGRRIYLNSGHTRPIAKRQQGRIRVLIVAPQYFGRNELIETAKEARAIKDLFESLKSRLGDVVTWEMIPPEDATWENFRHKVSEEAYDIIHFAGHGSFKESDPESSAWIFNDNQPITAESFRRFMHNHPSPPWLVYANACQSAADTGATIVETIGSTQVAGGYDSQLRTAFPEDDAAESPPSNDGGDAAAAGFAKEQGSVGATGSSTVSAENPAVVANGVAATEPVNLNGVAPVEINARQEPASGEVVVGPMRDDGIFGGTRDGVQKRMPYQGEVFGLASAFIGQGVDAYIGSLWKIDDKDAATIAVKFYEELLLNRATLGEALLRAKEACRYRKEKPQGGSLSWTGLVLYGDPTGELVQALAGGEYRDPQLREPETTKDGAQLKGADRPDERGAE